MRHRVRSRVKGAHASPENQLSWLTDLLTYLQAIAAAKARIEEI